MKCHYQSELIFYSVLQFNYSGVFIIFLDRDDGTVMYTFFYQISNTWTLLELLLSINDKLKEPKKLKGNTIKNVN
jgi:hypothetical protein